jgi:hypothetical protein
MKDFQTLEKLMGDENSIEKTMSAETKRKWRTVVRNPRNIHEDSLDRVSQFGQTMRQVTTQTKYLHRHFASHHIACDPS